MVFVEASATMNPAPTSGSSTSESQSVRDSPNAISPPPKTITDTAMTPPSPTTDGREAR